jgi:hypothetical protein
MRMLGPSGNPQARNLLEVINHLSLPASGAPAELIAIRDGTRAIDDVDHSMSVSLSRRRRSK